MNDADRTENEAEEIEEIDSAEEAMQPHRIPGPETARLVYSAYAEMRPSPGSKYAPMGLFGYILILLATSVPVVGFIAAVVVAIVSKKLARKRLAASIAIIRAVLFALLGIAAAVAVLAFDFDIASQLSSLFNI